MVKNGRVLIALGIVLLLAACASQRTDRAIAYNNFRDGDYADTISWIRRTESRGDVTPELRAELTYLEARSLDGMGEYARSEELYAYLVERHADSRYSYLARGRLAGGIESPTDPSSARP